MIEFFKDLAKINKYHIKWDFYSEEGIRLMGDTRDKPSLNARYSKHLAKMITDSLNRQYGADSHRLVKSDEL